MTVASFSSPLKIQGAAQRFQEFDKYRKVTYPSSSTPLSPMKLSPWACMEQSYFSQDSIHPLKSSNMIVLNTFFNSDIRVCDAITQKLQTIVSGQLLSFLACKIKGAPCLPFMNFPFKRSLSSERLIKFQ